VFESSSGYSFSNKNTKNPLYLIKLYNSGYQNISIYTNTGFRNDQAKISLDGYFSNADLYVPNRINENHITYHSMIIICSLVNLIFPIKFLKI